jgi:prevent-host-death family protein
MASWQLQEAKQHFSELVRRTLAEGPQTVTRHGEEVVVIVSADDWRASRPPTRDFKAFLSSAPDFDALELGAARRGSREVDL